MADLSREQNMQRPLLEAASLRSLGGALTLAVALTACAAKDEVNGEPADDPSPTTSEAEDASPPGAGDDSTAEDPTSTTEPISDWSYAACPAEQSVGGFTLLLSEKFTSFQGKVNDAVLPSSVPIVIATDGDCSLLDAKALSCDDCDVATEACSPDGCVPLPVAHTLGVVSVSGLAAELEAKPNGRFSYTNPANFPHPGFASGADILLQSEGGDFPALQLRGFGVSPLELTTPSVNLERGTDAVITWSPPEVEGPTKVVAMLNVNRHGSSSGWISCEAADTGRLVISAELVSQLMDRGLSGWPTLEIRRQSADSTELDGAGCVELLVQAPANVDVTVEGLISCNNPEDCPDGQTCNMVLNCE